MASKPSATKKKTASKSKKSSTTKKSKQLNVPTFKSGVMRNFAIIKRFWKPLGLATLIYGGLYFVFIRVLTNVNFQQLNTTVVQIFGEGEESIVTRAVSVGTLFGQSTNFSGQTGVMYFAISLVCSLAIIWLLRSIWSSRKVSVKEAFYQGMYPFVPVILLVIWMFIQAIPFSISSFLFRTAFDQGLASSFIEKVGFVGLLMGGILLSGYWIIGTIMGFYAVTVPGKTPSEALQTSAAMLKGRRFATLRLAIQFLLLTSLMILIPMLGVIYVIPDGAIVFAALFIVLSLPWLHIYFYGLYRDLLHEQK